MFTSKRSSWSRWTQRSRCQSRRIRSGRISLWRSLPLVFLGLSSLEWSRLTIPLYPTHSFHSPWDHRHRLPKIWFLKLLASSSCLHEERSGLAGLQQSWRWATRVHWIELPGYQSWSCTHCSTRLQSWPALAYANYSSQCKILDLPWLAIQSQFCHSCGLGTELVICAIRGLKLLAIGLRRGFLEVSQIVLSWTFRLYSVGPSGISSHLLKSLPNI